MPGRNVCVDMLEARLPGCPQDKSYTRSKAVLPALPRGAASSASASPVRAARAALQASNAAQRQPFVHLHSQPSAVVRGDGPRSSLITLRGTTSRTLLHAMPSSSPQTISSRSTRLMFCQGVVNAAMPDNVTAMPKQKAAPESAAERFWCMF